MVLVLLGVPGAGKGTQAKLLEKNYSMHIISPGDILRESHSPDDAHLISQAKSYLQKGELVPDNLIIELVKRRISPDKNHYIFDGFPRTIVQAKALEELLKQVNLRVDKVFYFDIEEEKIIERITQRRVCSACGKNYHLKYQPPKKIDVCDSCGAQLYQRVDDTVEVLKNRITAYKLHTQPLLEYYSKKNLLVHIDASLLIDQVYQSIITHL